MSTLAASYLAKMRGSGEPEASAARIKDIENFQREIEATKLDMGHIVGPQCDEIINGYRRRFEEIMGNPPTGIDKVIREKLPGGLPV